MADNTNLAGTGSTDGANDPITGNQSNAQDPFAGQRESNDPLTKADTAGSTDVGNEEDALRTNSESLSPPASPGDRRMSREWDASKVPPSQFQRRKGSIYSTPSSRDSRHDDSSRDKAYHEKLAEKGKGLFGLFGGRK